MSMYEVLDELDITEGVIYDFLMKHCRDSTAEVEIVTFPSNPRMFQLRCTRYGPLTGGLWSPVPKRNDDSEKQC